MSTKKAIGFYIGIVAAVLCIITAVMYNIKFSPISYKEQVYDSNICILLAATAIISVVMLFVQKLMGFAPVVLCAGSGISALMYVKMVIWPVSDTIYGIEPFAQINEVIICAILLVVSFILSECSLYMKKSKEVTE